MQRLILVPIAAVCVAWAGSAAAQSGIGAPSEEQWIDGGAAIQPGVDPDFPDAAVDGTGRSLYVWKAFVASTRNDIYLRRFAPDGTPLDDPVLVNTLLDDDQMYPRIAVGPNDAFLVIWQSQEPDPTVLVDRYWIRSQLFGADGTPIGSEQLLSTMSTCEATDVSADVAALDNGTFVAVWQSRGPGCTTTGGATSILARMIGANGVPLSAPFVANSTTDVTERQSAVTALADGGFLVVWANPDIHGRRFSAAGAPVGEDFKIDTFDGGIETDPDVAVHEDGRVLVVWSDSDTATSTDQIRGRMLASDLTAQGDDFPINVLMGPVVTQEVPQVAPYGKAGFFVAWQSNASAGTDADARSVQARMVRGVDQFASAQFQVNVFEVQDQRDPGIGGQDGRVAIGWHSKGNDETTVNVLTGVGWSICGIFCDGFEGPAS